MSPSTLVLREKFLVKEPSSPTCEEGKILLVNGHQPTREAIKNLLEAHNYRVQATGEGALAFRAAKEDLPDIILLDTTLQDMTGFDLCQRLKDEETTRHIPVLFVVSAEQPGVKGQVFKVGGSDFITDPLCSEEVLRRLEIQLEMRRLKSMLEKELKEKEQLSRENKEWERSFSQHVKESTAQMEEVFILERSAREQMINAATLTMMNKMAAKVVQELSQPLYNLQLILVQVKELAKENPEIVNSLEYSLAEVERLLRTITELSQIREL